jgi:hypothetical protein
MDGPKTVSTVSREKPLIRLRAFLVSFFVTSLKRGANEMFNLAQQSNPGQNPKARAVAALQNL